MICIVVYLTHLDYQDTERIMTEKLQNQVNGTEWSWKNLNTVSCFYFTFITWVYKSCKRGWEHCATIQLCIWVETIHNLDMTLLTALLGSWFNQWSNARRGWEKILGYSHQGMVKFKPSVLFHYFWQVNIQVYILSPRWPVIDSVFARSLVLVSSWRFSLTIPVFLSPKSEISKFHFDLYIDPIYAWEWEF